MRGTITGRELFLQLATIVRRRGIRAFARGLRALVVEEQTRFLEAVRAPVLVPVRVSRASGGQRPPRWR